jgi:hypothetical protein
VETIDRACDLFALEIYALGRAYYHDGQKLVADPDGVIAVLFTGRRGAALLATCVRSPGVSIGDELADQPETQQALARAVCRLCDIRRIIRSLNLRETTARDVTRLEPEPGEPQPSALDQAVAMLARLYGGSPWSIMRWPYEALLTCTELLQREQDEQEPARQAAGAGVPWIVNVHPAPEA